MIRGWRAEPVSLQGECLDSTATYGVKGQEVFCAKGYRSEQCLYLPNMLQVLLPLGKALVVCFAVALLACCSNWKVAE